MLMSLDRQEETEEFLLRLKDKQPGVFVLEAIAGPPGAPAQRVAAPEPGPAVVAAVPAPEEPVQAVRIVDSTRTASPHAMSPTTFNDAQGIGDRFKGGQPVIVNLQGADRDLRRRLVDFASGLCYALGGKMERVADQVYLLTPADVEVAVSDRRAFD